MIQAFPFVLVGALAAAAIEVFVPLGTLEKLTLLPRPLQLPAAALAGIAFPICECGSVPVARRLAARGLMPPPSWRIGGGARCGRWWEDGSRWAC